MIASMSSSLFDLAIVRRLTSSRVRKRPPLHLVLPSIMVAAAMLLPLIYLVIRSAGASENAWQLLIHPRLMNVLGNSLVLAGAVTVASNLIAVPLAWLTVRSDLPGRRFWSVITVLPLVIPSYVGSYAIVAALG